MTGQAGLVSPQGGWPLWRTGACLLWTTDESPPARPSAQESPGALGGVNAPLQGSQSWLGDPRLANLYQQLDPNRPAYHTYCGIVLCDR